MELVVRALRCPPPDQPQAIHARFGAHGGRIGRSNTCALPLPSPDRYISREHLEIRCRDGKFTLKVISKVNGCSVNDNAVPPGSAVELAHGDKIQIGDYVLLAELQSDATALMKDPLAAFGRTPSGRVDSLDMMASLAPPPAGRDQQFDTSPDWARAGQSKSRTPPPPPLPRLADPLEADPSGTALGRMLESAPSASRNAPVAAPMPKPVSPLGRDDSGASALDAFLGLDGPLASPAPIGMSDQAQGLYRQRDVDLAMPGQGVAPAADPFDDDIFSALDALEKDFAPPPPAAPPPASRVRAPAPAAAAADPLDMDLLGGAAVAPVAAPAHAPVARGAAHAAPAGAVDSAQLMAALAKALSLQPGDLDADHPLETIRIVGELLNLTVGGLYQMLEMRAQLKNELRIEDRTIIASRENNPMKHSDNAADALRYLVDVRQHGNKLFMQPAKAVGDAVSDVCAHEMAVMAGTRAALLAALKMFSPEVVEKRIKKSGALDSVVPALHRAKLWESFLAMYGELEKEAEDHFDRLLNQEFARAYAEQGKKLRRKK
jgi:type VI secretion system FHA domain protein